MLLLHLSPMDIHSLTFFLVTNGISLGNLSLAAALMLRMNNNVLERELPTFYAYVIFSFLQGTALFCIRNYFGFGSLEYFLAYWLLNAVDTVLAFFIIQEVYANALYRYDGLRSLSQQLFRWAFIVLVIIAGVTALTSPAADRDFLYSWILLLNRSAMIVELGLMVLLFVLAKSLTLGWKECVFGIAVGMCFYCSVQLTAVSLRAHLQGAVASLYAIIKPLVGVTTMAIWTAYFYRAERARDQVVPLRNTRLGEWNAAVLQFLNR